MRDDATQDTPDHSASTGTLELYRQVWKYAAGVRGRYLFALVLLLGSQVVKLLVPWLAAQAIDTIQSTGTTELGKAGLYTGAIFLVYVVSWSMHGPGRILERNVGLQVRAAVSDALYARLSNLPLAWHDVYHSGEVQHRAQQASAALAGFAQSQFVYLQNAVNILGPLVALYILAPAMGVLALAGYVGVATVIIHYDRKLMRLAADENRRERRYAARLLDFLGNVGTVLSLRLQAVSRLLLAERLAAAFVPLRTSIVITEVKWCAVDLLTIGLTWSLVALYAWLAHRSLGAGGTLLLGGVFMVYQYAQQAGSVIGSMAANLQNFARVKTDFASADPIFEASEREAPIGVDPHWREIAARGLELVYIREDGARGGVQDVSITLVRGERIALIGPSGGGKSTLLRLLAGLYDPQRGYYQVDGATCFGVRNLGAIATLIPQEAEIFEGTVRENLTFGLAYPREAIERACHLSVFDAVVHALPHGLDTMISERGFNLSGGQRQRLALARGLLAARDSSLLLLDEPTSALDQRTESRIFRRLRQSLPDTTVVASVHRMNALPNFDRILLMADGRVLDFGTVDEVLRRQPLLREMVEAGHRPPAEDEVAELTG